MKKKLFVTLLAGALFALCFHFVANTVKLKIQASEGICLVPDPPDPQPNPPTPKPTNKGVLIPTEDPSQGVCLVPDPPDPQPNPPTPKPTNKGVLIPVEEKIA